MADEEILLLKPLIQRGGPLYLIYGTV